MSTLVVQADDLAISHATTLGILDAVDRRAVQATGIFTNTEDAGFAAEALRTRSAIDFDIGLDLNFVTARPVLPAEAVPDLISPSGMFRSSTAIKAAHTCVRRTGAFWEFDVEPFHEEQARLEAEAQLQRFVELFDRLPDYLHHHSLVTPVTDRVLRGLAAEHDLLVMDDLYRRGEVHLLPNDWYTSDFGLEAQAGADPAQSISALVEAMGEHETSVLITHPGYLDAELLELSSYSVVRPRDLQLLLDPRWLQALTAARIELATYSSLGLT